jgi:hypothetical protein
VLIVVRAKARPAVAFVFWSFRFHPNTGNVNGWCGSGSDTAEHGMADYRVSKPHVEHVDVAPSRTMLPGPWAGHEASVGIEHRESRM